MLGKVINMSPMKIYAYKIIPLYGKVYLMPNYSTGTKHLTFINAQVQKLEELEEETAYSYLICMYNNTLHISEKELMVHNNNGVPYRANILMYLKYSIAITTRHYYVCCRDGDFTELIVTVFGKTDQLVRNLIFMYTSNNCSDMVDANRNVE